MKQNEPNERTTSFALVIFNFANRRVMMKHMLLETILIFRIERFPANWTKYWFRTFFSFPFRRLMNRNVNELIVCLQSKQTPCHILCIRKTFAPLFLIYSDPIPISFDVWPLIYAFVALDERCCSHQCLQLDSFRSVWVFLSRLNEPKMISEELRFYTICLYTHQLLPSDEHQSALPSAGPSFHFQLCHWPSCLSRNLHSE